MTKAEELNLFLVRCDEFIEGKYILADIKIVNLLKSIASSKTLLAIFENCLNDFDYQEAKEKYLVKSKNLAEDKGEFILPPNSRQLLAFVFTLLMQVDSRELNLNDFINTYFYAYGSFSSGYAKFMTDMIKPFRNAVKTLMESVISGAVQDPVEALIEMEETNARKKAQEEKEDKQRAEMTKKACLDSVEEIRKILLEDKTKIKAKETDYVLKEQFILVIDMLANAVMSLDADAISYAFVAYKFMAKAYPLKFMGRTKKIIKHLREVYNAL